MDNGSNITKVIKNEIKACIEMSLTDSFIGKTLPIEEIESQTLGNIETVLQRCEKAELISSYQVDLVKESPEIQLVREIMEEPKDNSVIEFDIKIQTVCAMDYISIFINLEKGS